MSDIDLDALEERYTRTPVPPCRVCGGELELQSAGGGNAAKYAHSRPPGVMWNEWREHYSMSEWLQHKPGDSEVLAVIAEVRRLRSELRTLATRPDLPDQATLVKRLDAVRAEIHLWGTKRSRLALLNALDGKTGASDG